MRSACSCNHKDPSSDPSFCNKPGMVLFCVSLSRVKARGTFGLLGYYLAKPKCSSWGRRLKGVGGRGTLPQRKKVESDIKKKKRTPNTTLHACICARTRAHTLQRVGRANSLLRTQCSREKKELTGNSDAWDSIPAVRAASCTASVQAEKSTPAWQG